MIIVSRRAAILPLFILLMAARPIRALDAVPAPDFVVAPNANATEALKAVQKSVRELKARLEKSPRPILVWISKGDYFLTEPWTFEAQDSGTEVMPIIYAAEDGATLSGGVKLSGLKSDEKGRWQTTIPEVQRGEWSFSELFVNGQRRFRPRLPKESFYFIEGELPPSDNPKGKGYDRFVFSPGQIDKNWRNLGDVEILPFHNWTMSRLRISEIDDAAHAVSLSSKTPSQQDWNKLAKGRRFLVENVFEALDTPGQWYLDNMSGVLTYLPLPRGHTTMRVDGFLVHSPEFGDNLQRSEVIAPRLERLVEIKGGFTPETAVSHIQFRNLTFKHCNVKFPAQGYASPQAEVNIPGAIHATGANHCEFNHCTVTQVGGYGIELAAGCKDNLIDDCDLTDLGAGGIKIGDTRVRDEKKQANEIAERNTIRNCFIAYGGRHYPAAIGIWIGQSPSNVVEHNEIFDFYYSALSVGWTWGYGASNARDNTFAYNHIHEIGQGVLTDMGGIYTLGVRGTTSIHHNLFHDIVSHDYGGWGIYYDEGSTGAVAENNVVYNCKSASFHQHYGKENVVQNNILAFGGEHQLMRTRPENHLTLTIERNIVYFKDANILGSNWTGGKFALDNNLYWNAGTQPLLFNKLPIVEWRKSGHDEHSIIEDPLFVDPDKFDFRLKENSPASKIGFKPIDLTGVGPARARTRVENWPRAFPPRLTLKSKNARRVDPRVVEATRSIP